MDFILAIHIIQKNERGRQGRDRFQKFLDKIKNQVKMDKLKSQTIAGKSGANQLLIREAESALVV